MNGKKLRKVNQGLLLMLCMLKKGKIYPSYVSKLNLNHEKQVNVLMIPDIESWHYPAVKKLTTLLIGITSKHKDNFYCLNCPHSFRKKVTLELYKNMCANEYFCYIMIPSEDTKLLDFN